MRSVVKNSWLCLGFGLVIFPLVHTFIALQSASWLRASAAHTTDFFMTCVMTGIVAGSVLGMASTLSLQLRQEGNGLARVFCFISGLTGIAIMLKLGGYTAPALLGALPWLLLPVTWCVLLIFCAIFVKEWNRVP